MVKFTLQLLLISLMTLLASAFISFHVGFLSSGIEPISPVIKAKT